MVMYTKISNEHQINPLRNCSFLEYLTFSWIFPVLKYGYRNNLTDDDVYSIGSENSSKELVKQMETQWSKECAEAKEQHREANLLRVAVRCFKWHLIWVLFLGISSSIAGVSLPFFIERMVSSVAKDNSVHKWLNVLFFILGMICWHFLGSHAAYKTDLTGVFMKSSLTGLTYKKVLTLDQSTLTRITAGHVLTLISTDITEINGCFESMFLFFGLPFELLFSGVFLWIYVGWVALIGMAINIALSVCLVGLAFLSGHLRSRTARCTDKRVRLIREMLKYIAEIKMNIWEEGFNELIGEKRRDEMTSILSRTIISVFQTVCYIIGSSLASLLTVLALALMGCQVTPAITFAVIAIYNRISWSIAFRIGQFCVKFQEAMNALERIRTFLLLNGKYSINRKNTTQRIVSNNQPDNKCTETGEVTLYDISCSYDENSHKALQNITCKLPRGQLIAIVGTVGSGKSSLLMSILGELPFTGKLQFTGSTAYTSQQPWIFPGSIRDNITCGRKMNSAFYKQVIESCGLNQDLESFAEGDFTMLDEAGSQLSGGQRSRVSLARAVYSDADIYLLDAPLSSLDQGVASWVFEECLCKLLAGETRLIVLNDHTFLSQCDKIVVLKDGRLVGIGSYEEMKDNCEFESDQDKIRSHNESSGNCETGLAYVDEGNKVIEEEFKEEGVVSLTAFKNYFHSGVPWVMLVFFVIMFISSEVSTLYLTWWLSRWTELPQHLQENPFQLIIYSCLVLLTLFLSVVKGVAFFYTTFRASKKMHQRMITTLLHAPLQFYQRNPVGRILNRFSADSNIVDTGLPIVMFNGITSILSCAAVIVFACLASFWLLIVSLALVIIGYFVLVFYMQSSNQLRRLESVTRSPVYSHVSTTLDGITSIHVYKREEEYINALFRKQDRNTSISIMCIASEMLLDTVVAYMGICFVVIMVCISINTVDLGLAAALLSLSPDFQRKLAATIILSGRLADMMTSVQRMLEYTRIEPEPGYQGNTPPTDWPVSGDIKVNHLSLTYPGSQKKTIKDVSFYLKDGEHVGIIGRTGAGKSSLIFSFLHFTEFEGEIIVGDLPLNGMGLKEARKCFTVVSQSPFLFYGTLRQNLDIRQEFSDKQLWDALADVNLQSIITNRGGSLECIVKESGSNFSEGERQLINLARALIQKRRIIILDEATANVDLDTDRIIQEVVRKNFIDRTVISVSHRVQNVQDMDKVIVFDSGRVVRIDKPCNLIV